MNIELLQEEAMASAAVSLSAMLQRPDQLEKVEQYRQRVTRKKTSVEAMLKTAVQSQLDGVISGLQQLQSALVDIVDIRQRLHEIEECVVAIPPLCDSVKNVREEHVIYSQYAVAMENLKHIFTVPESVDKTRQWISEGKLLHAHQSLTDLENSRDDLLYELHRLPNHSLQDKQMLKAYFSGVQQLSEQLGKQLWLLLGRSLNTVRKEPQVIVTAVRIIEREERADAYAIQRQKQSGFLPPGRPKKWKERALEVLSDAVIERIEGNQFEERADNKMWLVRHLEVTRLLIIEDLRVVKTLCAPCFPPHWDIVNQFFQKYHSSLSKHLEEVIAAGLVANEFVTLLSWVLQTYPGSELLRHADINIDPSSLGPLLNDDTIEKLFQAYISNMASNYNDWMQKTVDAEARDWRRPIVPESDGDGHYHTESIVIIFQMVEQNLSVSRTISDGLMTRALILGLEQITQYGEMYREAINLFKNKHFEDRSQVPYFTHYMIAIINNCLHAMELAQEMKTRYGSRCDQSGSSAVLNKFENLAVTYEGLRNEAAGILLDEAFLDLEPHFQDLLTRKWVVSTVPVDTICATLEDYFQDYMHLKPRNFEYVIRQAEICITRKYITSIFQKKLSLKEERREVAEKIIQEAGQIEALLAPALLNRNSPSDASKATEDASKAISALAEVIKCDSEIITLELINFIKKYPDVSQDQLTYLLSLRGDFGRLEARQRVTDLLSSSSKGEVARSTIFSLIIVPSSIFS
ncbi:exocyst complex component 3-like [Daphnia carinata]|uniref:exocyst complex component 3-like n=1 Tax=Daphnia carinata TaxID=120202 RepID=UPI00257A1E7B|nr:exocyst complex component 3-like [Daphnia carinata]